MHVAALSTDMFEIAIETTEATLVEALPAWHSWDRFAIVVHEPYGAVGAGMLLQAVSAHFYALRRAHGIPDIYPEIYAVHVGRDHGDLSLYDVFPAHKERVCSADPAEVLAALLTFGITRLAVPDGVEHQHTLDWALEDAFRDRIATTLAYSPSGDTPDADLRISANHDFPASLSRQTLDPESAVENYPVGEDPALIAWRKRLLDRTAAMDAADLRAARRSYAMRTAKGLPTETYRRCSLDFALGRLVP